MHRRIYIVSLFFGFLLLMNEAKAICVNNQTDFLLYYEIQNLNNKCPIPKIKFYSGQLQGNRKICYAHSSAEGNDWKIYRNDLIKIYKVQNGKHELICSKNVLGILNTLNVSVFSLPEDHWWCLDRRNE